MRIMLDTNVLFSMIIFSGKSFEKLFAHITENHTLVLSTFVISELKYVTEKKFPEKSQFIDRFLSELSYELVYTPDNMDYSLFQIRDINDYPVLYSAIISNVDILITGDLDFKNVDIEHPEIMTPREYIECYCI